MDSSMVIVTDSDRRSSSGPAAGSAMRWSHRWIGAALAFVLVTTSCSSGGPTEASPDADARVPGSTTTSVESSTAGAAASTTEAQSTASEAPTTPTTSAGQVEADSPEKDGAETNGAQPSGASGSAAPLGTTAVCSDEGTHWYCVAPGAPVAPADHGRDDYWGSTVDFTPEVFCARDLPELACRESAVALLVAIGEWGNYGPVEYWVMGVDKAASIDLIGVNCDRRAERDQQSRGRCMERNLEETHGLLWYQEIGERAVAEGRARHDACHCGKREWGMHWLTSSAPFGLTDHFDVPGADSRVKTFHEYFHAVQSAHLMTTDHRERYEGAGRAPVWFHEGGADWAAQWAHQRLRVDGSLPEVNAEGREPFVFEDKMRGRMFGGKDDLAACPGATFADITDDVCRDAGYGLGSWAHAWLADRFGPDVLLDVFYPALDSMGWEGAFVHAYGITTEEFYDEFDRFLDLDFEEQLAILGMASVEVVSVAPTSTSAAPATTTDPPTTTVTQTTTTVTTVTPTTIATTTPVPVGPIGVDVDCSALATHWYCVAAGAPVAPASHGMNEFWGTTVGYTPEVFCASDLDEMVCRETTVALLVAIGEWGNYGPLEYWVMGVDESASMDLVEVHCDRRDERGQRNRARCLEREHDDGMMAYQRLTASAVAEGRPRENACHCGNREWGIHWLSSAMPFGYTDHFQVSGADARTTQFHEYFHAVQHSHLMTTDHWLRYDGGGMGPVWFGEGSADWMAQSAIQRLLADGTLPEVNTEGRGSFDIEQNMRHKLREGMESLAECPGANLGDVGYDNCNRASYSLGAWAHAWLADRFGPDVLLDVFYPELDAMGWEGAFIHAYAMTPDEFYDRFDEFLALDLDDQLAILPTGRAETAQPASTTTLPPSTTTSTTTAPPPTTTTSYPPAIRQTGPAAPTTTIDPSETSKEHLERIGVNVPKSDPQHWILFSESIPDDLVQQNAEIMDLVVGIVGGYDRYVHITYELDDPNTENLRILNELGVRNGTLQSINDVHEIRGCLAGFTAFERWDGKHEYSFCMQPNPLTDPVWENDRQNSTPDSFRYRTFNGWVHEYFHHYQKSYLFGRAMAMENDCCGLNDPIGAPAWWTEGSAMVFPDLFVREYFDELSYSKENGLSVDEMISGRAPLVINLSFEWIYTDAKRQAAGLDPGCDVVGPAEEYRDAPKCSWFLMNVYLAYLTSYQTLWVGLLEDMWELGFDGSFEKHVGMTKEEFYDSYNAFMRSGDPDDPPPPGFFPDRPLAELVDFWSIQSG